MVTVENIIQPASEQVPLRSLITLSWTHGNHQKLKEKVQYHAIYGDISLCVEIAEHKEDNAINK